MLVVHIPKFRYVQEYTAIEGSQVEMFSGGKKK